MRIPWPLLLVILSAGSMAAGTEPARHWAFEPLSVQPTPADASGWSAGPIDRFIAAQWRQRSLRPAPPADRATLVRRVHLDLLGLPPTPRQVAAFLDDDAPDAYERLVDRLLASPRYGERWGRSWLDVARYADTSGDGADAPIPEARLYRDYVIESFNHDLPYDQFIIEQIAGDILARRERGPRWRQQIIATGFIALSRRYDNSNNNRRQTHLMIGNTLDTLSHAALGLTLSCARCHDHKFDPIALAEYYGLYGYFSSTRYPHPGTEHGRAREGFVPLTNDAATFDRWITFDRRRYELTEQLNPFITRSADERKKSEEELEQLHIDYADVVDLPVAYSVIDKPADQIGHAKAQLGGNPQRAADEIPRGFLACLTDESPAITAGESGRLQLAHWLASPDQALPARVMVNRLWLGHLGRGLVPTPNSFGTQGQPPTHPQLLDWLADRFIREGWSIKKMHRRIVLSATYRMSSIAADDSSLAGDPDGRWYSHYPRRRLEAEAIRDAMLAVAGELDLSWPGPHPFPSTDKWGRVRFTQHRKFEEDYEHAHRGVYLMHRRLGKSAFMALFDAPDCNESQGQRHISTVPLQALFFMNGQMLHRSAAAMAQRLMRETQGLDAQVERAYQLAYGRGPHADELEDARLYVTSVAGQLTEGLGDNERHAQALASLCRVLLASNEFVHLE
jgi:hypothetical protein